MSDRFNSQCVKMVIDSRAASTDTDALLVMLQSACASVLEDSVYRLVGMKVSSAGYSAIIITIQVASEEEQQINFLNIVFVWCATM